MAEKSNEVGIHFEFISTWPPENLEQSELSARKRRRIDGAVDGRKCMIRDRKDFEIGLEFGQSCGTARKNEIERNSVSVPAKEKHIPLVTPALAKWWKERGGTYSGLKIPNSRNPSTILKWVSRLVITPNSLHVCLKLSTSRDEVLDHVLGTQDCLNFCSNIRLPEAREFMMEQVEKLQKQVPANPSCAGIYTALASYYSKMRDLTKAQVHLNHAHKLDPQNKEIVWLQVKLSKNKELQQQTQKCKEKFSALGKSETLKMPEPLKVERHHHASLSAKEFLFKYALTDTPVIITGLVEHMTPEPWTIQHIKKVIGHKNVPLKKRVKESSEWAKLEHACSMRIETFINSLQSSHEPLYLFDWSLPTFAPELVKDLTIPRYFAGDFLQRTATGSMYHDSWPSLFIAPAGLTSDLHVDAFGSNFWMALFEGRKRWTFFSKDDMPFLYPHCEEDSLNVSFDVDLAKPDLKDFPLLSKTTPRQCMLEPGELLFVPHGSPHFVENLEDSLAVSANYVDLSNYCAVLDELQDMAITDPQSESLHAQLVSKDFPSKMWSSQNDLSWEQFKQWERSSYKEYDIDFNDSVFDSCRSENH